MWWMSEEYFVGKNNMKYIKVGVNVVAVVVVIYIFKLFLFFNYFKNCSLQLAQRTKIYPYLHFNGAAFVDSEIVIMKPFITNTHCSECFKTASKLLRSYIKYFVSI